MARRSILVLGVAAALAVLLVVAWFGMDRSPPWDDDVAASQPPAALPSASFTSPTLPGEPAAGADVAWWDTGSFGFGVTGFEPQPLPAMPEGYRQLRVGTLDGRITAVRTLPDGWSRSYVSGPVGGDVLVVADDGETSVVSTITAATGAERTVFESEHIVPAAVLSIDGEEIWYVALRRGDGGDLGLWRRPRNGGAEEQVLPGPLGERFDQDGVTVWQLHFDAQGTRLAVQWCFGEVRCTTHLLDVRSGQVHTSDALSWPWGFTDELLVGREVNGGPVMALDLATGEPVAWNANLEAGVVAQARGSWWVIGAQGAGAPTRVLELVPGATLEELPGDRDPENTEFRIPFDGGIGPIPPGWAMRHPVAFGTWPEDRMAAARGELINVATGERLQLAAFRPDLAAPDCPILAPAVTPAGLAAGSSRSELWDRVRHVQWSAREDAVTLAVGVPVIGRLADLADMPDATVRGLPAKVVPIGDRGRGQVALVWEEDGCTYTAYLAPGTTIDAALEYAGRY